jgi:hypothetical protein
MEGVTLDKAGIDLLTKENMFEGALDGRGTCA